MIKKCLINIGVPLGFILSLIVFLLYSNVVLNGVICNSVIYGYMINLSSNFAQTCDLRQQLKLASRLQFDLQDTVDWNRKHLSYFNNRRIQLISFYRFNNSGAIDVKMDGLLSLAEIIF